MSKVGAHVNPGPRNGYGPFVQSKPAVCLLVGQDPAETRDKSGGHTITIFRADSVYGEAPPGYTNHPNPTALAAEWYPLLKAKWLQNQADYYQITNEQGGGEGPEVPDNLNHLVTFEREIMRLANLDGLKVCVLNLATGSPGSIETWQQICAPFILEAWAAGNIYGRHAYGGGDLVNDSGVILPGNPIRPFTELLHLRSLGAVGGIALTEVGLDGGSGYSGQERVLAQMSRYEQKLREYPEFIGLCWWSLGEAPDDPNWQNALPAVTQYNIDNPTPAWTVPGGQPPSPNNILKNPSYEGGFSVYVKPDGTPIQEIDVPDDYTLWFAPPSKPNPYDSNPWAVWRQPEAHPFTAANLPAHEVPLFIKDGQKTYKVFKGGGSIWFAPGQFVPAGKYKLTIGIFPDNVVDIVNGQKVFATDPNSCIMWVYAPGKGKTPEQRPVIGQWNYVTFEFEMVQDGRFDFHVMMPFPCPKNNGCWLDDNYLLEVIDPMPTTWQEEIWQKSIEKQTVSLNPEAALQAAIFADGFVPVESEFWYTPSDNVQRACMASEHLGTGERRVYYAVVPVWNVVKWIGDPAGSALPFEFSAYPVKGRNLQVNSPFNVPRSYGKHEGIDLYALTGDKLVSVAPGVVDSIRLIDNGSGYGIYVRVNHDGRFKTWYGHMESVSVSLGQSVQAGDVLGFADSTGNSTGSHLHLTLQDLEQGLDGYVVDKVVDPAPFLQKFAAPPPTAVQMSPYFLPAVGDYGAICILKNNWGDGDERQQLQRVSSTSYVTKNQQWERRRIAADGIYLDLDTSPGNNEYYTISGTAWLPLSWSVGNMHSRTETVSFRSKSNCAATRPSYTVTTKILFNNHYPTWTGSGGIEFADVVELQWLIGGIVEETYWYARGLGLVEWLNRSGKHSWATDIIPVGQQTNNVREVGCFG